TFLIVRRKLDSFDGRHLAAWIYRITQSVVRDYRRRAWFRRVFFAEVEEVAAPGQLAERVEAQQLVGRQLEKMSVKHRTAFVLFEIEGYSGEEIAALEGVPVATVWTRLHHARKQFVTLVAEQRGI